MFTIHSIAGRVSVGAGIAVALVAGGAAVASANTIHSSMVDFYTGDDGVDRYATTSNQTFDFLATCYWGPAGSETPVYAAMQLQRVSGLGVVVIGNKNVGCASSSGAQNWGAVTPGLKYHYQLNGVKIASHTGLVNGPFSDADILITY